MPRARWVTLRARWANAESSLGDAKSSLGDAESSLGDAKSSLGDAKSWLGDAKSLAGDVYRCWSSWSHCCGTTTTLSTAGTTATSVPLWWPRWVPPRYNDPSLPTVSIPELLGYSYARLTKRALPPGGRTG
jgi:hypothetical protein